MPLLDADGLPYGARGPLFNPREAKHQPGFAVPKKFEDPIMPGVSYELDVIGPDAVSPDWWMLLVGSLPGFPVYPCRWNGDSRPTAKMEEMFLRHGMKSVRRFYRRMLTGHTYGQAVMAMVQDGAKGTLV